MITFTDTNTHTPQSVGLLGPSQRPLPHNTQHSQEKDIHASGGIRTRNPRNRATAELLVNRVATDIGLEYHLQFCLIFHPIKLRFAILEFMLAKILVCGSCILGWTS